jgi:hypothetical protein
MNTKYEDGFKAGMKAGQEEIDRTQAARHDDDELGEQMTQQEFDEWYPFTLAAIYASEQQPDDGMMRMIKPDKHLVIKPEPIDPKRRTYDDGFIDGCCCIMIANSDILMENLKTPFADAWRDKGWHKAMARALHRAGFDSGTVYSPDVFNLVKVSG